jgi:hypothetical protein
MKINLRIMNKIFSLKIIALLGFVFMSFSIKSQNIEVPDKSKNNEPDVQINVNRELDKDGNVVKYDSTYSWSWSSDGTQGNFFNDSINLKFFNQFDHNNLFDDPFFSSFGFSNDSLANNNSANSNFDALQKQMIEMMQRQQQMMNEMFNQKPSIITEPDKNNEQNIAPEKKASGNGIDI